MLAGILPPILMLTMNTKAENKVAILSDTLKEF
jgi:hypothetical protein